MHTIIMCSLLCLQWYTGNRILNFYICSGALIYCLLHHLTFSLTPSVSMKAVFKATMNTYQDINELQALKCGTTKSLSQG